MEERNETELSETYVIRKYMEDEYESGDGPYEEITLVYEDGVLVSQQVVRREEDNGTN